MNEVITLGLICAIVLGVDACSDRPKTYKATMASAEYKVGDTALVQKGFYAGCHLKVNKIEVRYNLDGGILEYEGVSKDCPRLIGFDTTGDSWSKR